VGSAPRSRGVRARGSRVGPAPLSSDPGGQTANTATTAETLAALLQERAAERGDRPAYTFLPDGEREGRSLSYAELEREARAIGARLQAECEEGDRALILTDDGIDFVRSFMACQLARVIAVPAYPPLPMSPRRVATLRAIATESGATAVLGSPGRLRETVRDAMPDLARLRWIAVDEVPADAADGFRPVAVRGDHVSFLQYTSGSTALPKGVVVTHGALMHNEHLLHHAFDDPTPDDVGVCWLPLFHDMGLIGFVIATVYEGGHTVLMPPLAFLQRPARWLRAIARYGGTHSGGPNFGYEHCLRRIPPAEREGLDLSSWRLAFNGAEPVRAATLDAFAEAFGPYGFDARAWYPCYGMAEATLIGTGPKPRSGARRLGVRLDALQQGRIEPGGDHVLVGCGSPTLHRELAIVDPDTCLRVEPGAVGEIWLAGPDIAREYWARPEESTRTFDGRIADTGEGPFLRTGDLGAVHDGELFVTGRLKDVIIVGGRNHYPQDIEATVQTVHPAIRQDACVAFSVERDGREELVIVAGTRAQHDGVDTDLDEVARAIRAAVASEHGIRAHQVVPVKPSAVPRTSSGKLQRSACRAAFERGELAAAGRGVSAPLEAVR
jgi:acyl-CoA synthetase (AMP-forming)/AMP-acid ligase II